MLAGEWKRYVAEDSVPLGGAFWDAGAEVFINKGVNGRWSDTLTPEEVAAKIESGNSTTVRLKQKLPVHITYFTAWPDAAGNMVYFNDIYGRDRTLEMARSATLVAQR